MSSVVDPAKLKVVELRAELSARGLDTKGNKPVLVKRLREALEAESGKDFPDTSIADTSTEDLNSSVDTSTVQPPTPEKHIVKEKTPPREIKENLSPKKSPVKNEKAQISEPVKEKESKQEEVTKKKEDITTKEETVEKMDTSEEVITDQKSSVQEPETNIEESAPEEPEEVSDVKQDETERENEVLPTEDVEMKEETPQEDANQETVEKEPAEPRNRKSRWGSMSETEPVETTQEIEQSGDNAVQQEAPGSPRSGDESRGEKRRHDSPVSDRQVRRRSRSPVREDEPDIKRDTPYLSWIDSDLNLQVNKENFLSAEPFYTDGFGYMWAGVRASHGFNKGKICYEVKLLENCDWTDVIQKDKNKTDTNNGEESENNTSIENCHIFRVGWSLGNTNLQLGEQQYSYAYDSEGFAVCNSEFTEYGKSFASGDVVTAFLDLDSDEIKISYAVNAELQPVAFTVPRGDLPEDSAFFPHLLTRNIKFEVNFGDNEEPWFPLPEDMKDYVFASKVEEKIIGLQTPEKRQDCEVIMMVGLPYCGKTYWVNKYVSENQDKKYTVLGITNILDKMTVKGKPRKENFQGNWSVLLDKCTRCLNKLVDMSATRRRNYILDQTNLYSSAQRRKLRPFEGFQRRAVVIVLADDDQMSREKSGQQADGKDVPDSTSLELKANMCLPSVCDWLEEVTYVELDETKSKEMVQKYNKMGRDAGYTAKQHSNNQKSKSGGSTANQQDRRGQWNRNNKRDNRDNRNNRWSGGGHGHNRPNNWGGNRGSGGNWSRHDSRNQHHGGGGGGGGYNRNNPNNRMLGGPGGGGGYNRNQRGGGSYNRDRNPPPHRTQMQNKGGNWGQGGGNWGNQGNWGGQGGWGHQSGGQGSGGGWSQGGGNWGQYTNQGSNNAQWRSGGYGSQGQYQQQNYPQGYQPGQYGGQQYPNWNYYGQYAQGWCPPQANVKKTQSGFKDHNHGQNSNPSQTDDTSNSQYNQYSQQQQAAWAQYAQSGYGSYGQSSQSSSTTGTSTISTQPETK